MEAGREADRAVLAALRADLDAERTARELDQAALASLRAELEAAQKRLTQAAPPPRAALLDRVAGLADEVEFQRRAREQAEAAAAAAHAPDAQSDRVVADLDAAASALRERAETTGEASAPADPAGRPRRRGRSGRRRGRAGPRGRDGRTGRGRGPPHRAAPPRNGRSRDPPRRGIPRAGAADDRVGAEGSRSRARDRALLAGVPLAPRRAGQARARRPADRRADHRRAAAGPGRIVPGPSTTTSPSPSSARSRSPSRAAAPT